MDNSQIDMEMDAPAASSQPTTKEKKPADKKWKQIVSGILKWAYHLRKVVMAAPVVYYALKLAAYNSTHLPEQVGIGLQASGEFMQTVARSMAVLGPLGITAACLLLMFCSRKAIYTWAISIFTLVLPLLLLISNLYPA